MSDAQKPDDVCQTCGATEPYTGSCGTSASDTKALCKRQPPTLTPPDGWAEAVGLAKIMAQLSKPLSEHRAEILAQAIIDMDKLLKEVKP